MNFFELKFLSFKYRAVSIYKKKILENKSGIEGWKHC